MTTETQIWYTDLDGFNGSDTERHVVMVLLKNTNAQFRP